MDDFGKFVYLDVEKTGSTYISAFLEQHANLQRKKFKKHARVTDDVSVRRRCSAAHRG